jgi:SAM-dependent methyltransferase
VYDELFQRVPHHSMLTRKASPEKSRENLAWQLGLLAGVLDRDVTFLELGPGDCALAFAVANVTRQVYAVDVSETITSSARVPDNFRLILSDGASIDVPKNSVDVVYSNQLMEHLHPDDVVEQLENVLDVLSPGGRYICVTPNRLNGPHDISRNFDRVARGFHLREYTVTELSTLFRQVGFTKIGVYVGGHGRYWKCPVLPVAVCEALLGMLPFGLRRALASSGPVRALIGIRLVGTKP